MEDKDRNPANKERMRQGGRQGQGNIQTHKRSGDRTQAHKMGPGQEEGRRANTRTAISNLVTLATRPRDWVFVHFIIPEIYGSEDVYLIYLFYVFTNKAKSILAQLSPRLF